MTAQATAANRPTRRARRSALVGVVSLFGEALLAGLTVVVLSIPLFTLIASISAASNHLRRHLHNETTSLEALWLDWIAGIRSSWRASMFVVLSVAFVALEVIAAAPQALPGGGLIRVLLVVIAASVLAAAFRRGATVGTGGTTVRAIIRSIRIDRYSVGSTLTIIAASALIYLVPAATPAVPGIVIFAFVVIADRERMLQAHPAPSLQEEK